jgi:hypothetical protein
MAVELVLFSWLGWSLGARLDAGLGSDPWLRVSLAAVGLAIAVVLAVRTAQRLEQPGE